MGSLSRAARRRQAQQRLDGLRRRPLDYRRFKRAPEVDPKEHNAVAAEVQDALRRGDAEPDQNRKVGKMFEDVLDTVHSKNVAPLTQTTAEREAEEAEEAALLLALRRKLRGTLRGQGILLSGVEPDGLGQGYLAIAHDGHGRQFEAHFTFAEGMALGADSPHGLVDRVVSEFHEKIVEARNTYYSRACIEVRGA